jgi:hypothetical protein
VMQTGRKSSQPCWWTVLALAAQTTLKVNLRVLQEADAVSVGGDGGGMTSGLLSGMKGAQQAPHCVQACRSSRVAYALRGGWSQRKDRNPHR